MTVDEIGMRITARFVASGHFSSHLSTETPTPAKAADLPDRCPGSTAHNTDRRFFNFRTGFCGGNFKRDEPVGSSRESLIRASGHDADSVQKDACVLLSTMSASGAAARHAARLPHAKRHKWQTDGCAPQPVLCSDIRFQFFHGGSGMGSLSGPG